GGSVADSCPLNSVDGDGLPNSLSDTQDSTSFDRPHNDPLGGVKVCQFGSNTYHLFSRFGTLNDRHCQVNDNRVEPATNEDPDYPSSSQAFVFRVEPAAFLLGASRIRLVDIGQGVGNDDGVRLRGAWFAPSNGTAPLDNQYDFQADYSYVSR